MRVGILADAHGNITALDAVIADSQKYHVDEYIVIGDMTMKGPSPKECFDRVEALNPIASVIGNHEDCYNFADWEYEVHPKFDCSVIYAEYDMQFLTSSDVEKLVSLPVKQTVEVEGLLIDVFHASPTNPSAGNVYATADQANFDAMFTDSTSDLAVFGHVHTQMFQMDNRGRAIINAGSIGLPRPDINKSTASYVMLEIVDGTLLDIQFRRVLYDTSKEVALANERDLVYKELYLETVVDNNYSFTEERFAEINKRMGYVDYVRQKYNK